jgi:predicted nuclease with TOPRIM domain
MQLDESRKKLSENEEEKANLLDRVTAQENEIQNMKDCVSSPNEEMVSMSVV